MLYLLALANIFIGTIILCIGIEDAGFSAVYVGLAGVACGMAVFILPVP